MSEELWEKMRLASLEGSEMRLDSAPTKVEFLCNGKVVLTLTRDGIYADKDVRVGDAAKAVFEALEPYIRDLQPKWRPIETALTDGNAYLILRCRNPSPHTCVGTFYHGRWKPIHAEFDLAPTHWMPLPRAPK